MIIYKDYDTTDLLFNKPCEVYGLGKIYPILVKDYKKFQKYVRYLMLSEKHLNLSEDVKLLDGIIIMMSGAMCKNPSDSKELNSKALITLNELSELLSIITKKKVSFTENRLGYSFKDSTGEVNINSDNFDTLRQIVLKMCLIKEPKVFKDKLTQKWYEKALIAKRKKSPEITMEDIIITISQDMKMSFNEIAELNIFQLYSYYYRINHVENYKAITIFRTCSTGKLPNVNYSDGVLNQLLKEETLDDYTISADSIGKML